MAEHRTVSTEMKALIGLAAGILSLFILTVTFATGFYAGWSGFMISKTGQKAALTAGVAQQKLGNQGANLPNANLPGAQNKQGPQGQQLQDKIKQLGGTIIRGEVTAINGRRITVTTQQGETKTGVVADDAIVQRGQQAADFSEIAAGDNVALVGSLNDDGTLQVKAVRILAGQPAP